MYLENKINNFTEYYLKPVPPKVQLELGFWKASSDLKYNQLKLGNSEIDIFGFYNPKCNNIRIREESLKISNNLDKSEFNNLVKGKLRLLNSISEVINLNNQIKSNPQAYFSTEFEILNNWFNEIKHEQRFYPFSFELLIFFDFKKQIAYYSICFSYFKYNYEFKLINNNDNKTNQNYDNVQILSTFNDKYRNDRLILNIKSIIHSKLFKDIISNLLQETSLKNNNVLNCPWFFIGMLSFILFSDNEYGIDKHNFYVNSIFIEHEHNIEINDDKLLIFDLKPHFDSYTMQQRINNINIDLIKWRIAPEFDPNKFKNLRFLLIGSGTLGCCVSRNLIGWGIRNITLIDNSEVGLNNPSRQCLFTLEDAKSKKNKASAAIERLKYICPDIIGQGLPFDVPILGDPTINDDEFVRSCDELKEIIRDCDVVLLLTDTKESRLIPTILISFINRYHRKKNKQILCITVGLGFDSFIITRNTFVEDEMALIQNNTSNGCYFCGDLSVNSKTDLYGIPVDQQCSVVRIGSSYFASAIAVELIINLSQTADYWNSIHSNNKNIMGSYPQCIRGFLSNFSITNSFIQRNDNCIACSKQISNEMFSNEKNFLCQIFNCPKKLELFSGLDKYVKDIENNISVIEDI